MARQVRHLRRSKYGRPFVAGSRKSIWKRVLEGKRWYKISDYPNHKRWEREMNKVEIEKFRDGWAVYVNDRLIRQKIVSFTDALSIARKKMTELG